MSPDSLYFSLVVSHAPKWVLMAIVTTVLLVCWRGVSLEGSTRRLAWAGLGLYAFVVVATPLLYGWLRWRAIETGIEMQALGHALIGGALTIAEFVGVLLLGLAVAAGRGKRR
ncbi:hypothetical protein [Solilutibacter tolerans]|uniref:Transmembrane protein n=1 Tax=Solilutibacter tolerans TaxID=1604334 RepID=A0A1N6RQ83_9GAMM|nr:hypothetical protein [Lysobacter tolerans]SIQ30967.1 hypothetical protein SAMN05421546_1067 [Lysobacter tolerans]